MGALATTTRSTPPTLVALALTAAAVLVAALAVLAPPVAIALPIAIVGTVAIIRYPVLAVVIIVFCAPLTARMPRGNLVPALKISEILICGTAALIGLRALVDRRTGIRLHRIEVALLVFMCIRGLVPFFVNYLRGWPIDIDMLKLYLAPLKYWVLVRLTIAACTTPTRREAVVHAALAAAGVFGLIGVAQFLRVPGVDPFLAGVYPSDRDVFVFEYAHRLSSVFAGNWNAAGFLMGASCILSLHWSSRHGRTRRRYLLLGSFFALCLVMTMSFTSIAATGLGVLLLGVRTKKIGHWLRLCLPFSPIGVLLVIAFLPYFEQRLLLQWGHGGGWVPETMQARFEIWSVLIWPYLRDNLWLGIGPSRFGWKSEENYYYFLVVKAGIPALIAFLVLLRVVAGRLRTRAARSSAVANYTWAILWMAMLSNLTGVFFEYAGIAELIWVFVGLSLAATASTSKPTDVPARRVA